MIRSQFLIVWVCLLSFLHHASIPVLALLSDEFAVSDRNSDDDIDTANDTQSWEQVRAHSELERVNELPWWADGEYESHRAPNRILDAVDPDDPVDEQKRLQDLTEKLIDAQTNRNNHRRRTKKARPSIVVKDGYCLPSPQPLFNSRRTCRRKRQRCGRNRGACCHGLKCSQTRSGRRCRPACSSPGRECSRGGTCCSRQCVKCNSGCQGRCGLGIELPKDNIQVRRSCATSWFFIVLYSCSHAKPLTGFLLYMVR
jgi:hypothetical protein